MHRRTFCTSAVAAAVTASLSACGARQQANSPGPVISAISMDGEELSIESAAIDELSETLQGQLYLQGDEGYDAAKVIWNGMFDDKRPAMVVRCAAVEDVRQSVNFARERDLLVSVKCGGHSLPGKSTSDGGMMIDLSQMHSTTVDSNAMTIRADGGSLLGHIDDAALAHDMMTTTGIVSHTGTGGFTLGGGVGRTDRKMGLAIDNLLAATVVTASGDVVRASAEENADLFWGLRGGGGNFGIATEFVYQLHPFNPTVFGGSLVYGLDKAFLEFYAELHETLPNEANVEPQLVPGAGDNGETLAVVGVTWCGDHAEGAKALAPMLEFAGLKSGSLAPFAYRDIQTSADGLLGPGKQYYLKSGFLNELNADAIDIIIEYANRGAVSSWFQHMGGATAAVAADATAYAHRGAAFNFGIMYVGEDPSQNEEKIAAVREYYYELQPHMSGFYTNLNEDDEKKTWGNYGENYPRLVDIKNKYDPTNLFRLNANIKPTV
jgi:FAD/FMN-containing dehydrogenase